MGKNYHNLCILDYLYTSLTNKCLIISYLGPDLGFERLDLRFKRSDLGFERPYLGFERPYIGFKRPDFGS